MLSDQLLDELRQLSLPEKLRVVQLLVNELATTEDGNLTLAHRQYEVWSPYDSAGAAEILLQMLDEQGKQPDV